MIKITVGTQKKARRMSEKEKRNTAYHEAGHAILSHILPTQDPVRQISIIPSGRALGYTLTPPTEDKYSESKQEMKERIAMMLGGRVAEQIIFGDYTGGASNDIQRATDIARKMVTEYGMSSLGPVQFEQQEGSVFLGRDYNKSRNFSGQVAFEIDQEMRKILDECYKEAVKIIKKERKLLDLIANTLLECETITKEQIDYLVEHGCLPDEDNEIDESNFKEVTLEDLTLTELKDLAKEQGIKGYSKMTRGELEEILKDLI